MYGYVEFVNGEGRGFSCSRQLLCLLQVASLRTLCFAERESVQSCILLNEGVGFPGVRQERTAVVD